VFYLYNGKETTGKGRLSVPLLGLSQYLLSRTLLRFVGSEPLLGFLSVVFCGLTLSPLSEEVSFGLSGHLRPSAISSIIKKKKYVIENIC
jgi:hypothetical protein